MPTDVGGRRGWLPYWTSWPSSSHECGLTFSPFPLPQVIPTAVITHAHPRLSPFRRRHRNKYWRLPGDRQRVYCTAASVTVTVARWWWGREMGCPASHVSKAGQIFWQLCKTFWKHPHRRAQNPWLPHALFSPFLFFYFFFLSSNVLFFVVAVKSTLCSERSFE